MGVFLFYLFFTLFGVVNIVTGIFVENAMAASTSERDVLIKMQMQQQEKHVQDMVNLFSEIDTDGGGQICFAEFERHLNDERAIAYFEAMKLDITDVGTLFQLMDTDHSGSIDIEEFISGCQKLKGESRALDTAVMQYELEDCKKTMNEFVEQNEKQWRLFWSQMAQVGVTAPPGSTTFPKAAPNSWIKAVRSPSLGHSWPLPASRAASRIRRQRLCYGQSPVAWAR